MLDSYCTEASHQSIAIEMKTFLALSHTAKSLVMSLAQEISRTKLWGSVNRCIKLFENIMRAKQHFENKGETQTWRLG